MLQFQTQGYNGYAVKYSPFFDSRIAVSASMNFGLVGNGRLYILNLTPNGIVAEQTYGNDRPITPRSSQPTLGFGNLS
jgi:peroxin-7